MSNLRIGFILACWMVLLAGWAIGQAPPRIAEGQILSGDQPLMGVVVVEVGEQDTVFSDGEGKFLLEVKGESGSIFFQASEYNPLEFKFTPESELAGMEIRLTTYDVGSVTIVDQFPNILLPICTYKIVEISDRVFEATQSVSLSEALNFVPGLRMETNCQNCGFSQLRMNGLPGAYSQVLIDGRPVFSALNGIYGLDQIPSAMTERVEVIRGSGQVQYGSGAIGGTVNVITRDPYQNSWEFGSRIGLTGMQKADQSYNANISRVSKDRKFGTTAFGTLRIRQPYDHDGDSFTEVTQLNGQGLGFRSFFRPNPNNRIVWEGHLLHEFRRGGNNLSLAPHESDIAEQLESWVGGGSTAWEHYSKDLNHRFSAYASALATRMDNYYGAGQDPNGYGLSRDFTALAGIQYLRHFSAFLGGSGNFSAGFEAKNDHMRDEKPGYNLFVDQNLGLLGVYAQHEWQIIPKLTFIPGLRMDYNNVSEEWLANPRVHVKWDLFKDLQLRASYAKGFRAPQVFSEDVHVELVAGEIQAIRLGQDLQSERSNAFTVEADYEWNVGKTVMMASVDGFYTRIQHTFVLEQAPNTHLFILEKQNGPAATVRGVNVEGKWWFNPQTQFQGGFTFQQSQYDSVVVWSNEVGSDQLTRQFLRTPNVYGNWLLYWQSKSGKWQASTSGVYTGSMLVPHFSGFVARDQLARTGDFWEFNIRLGYDWDFGKDICLNVFGGVQNVFNQFQPDLDKGPFRDASYVYGPSRPRTVFVGMKLGKGGR